MKHWVTLYLRPSCCRFNNYHRQRREDGGQAAVPHNKTSNKLFISTTTSPPVLKTVYKAFHLTCDLYNPGHIPLVKKTASTGCFAVNVTDYERCRV